MGTSASTSERLKQDALIHQINMMKLRLVAMHGPKMRELWKPKHDRETQ